MKSFLWVSALVLGSTFALKAQTNLPPAYQIKSDTAASVDISDKYWQLLEDPTGKLTINQVSSPAFGAKFHNNTTLTKGYDYHITHYWLRYKLKNTVAWPIRVTIPENVAYASLYSPQPNGKWTVEYTGTLVPWSRRSGLKRILQFEVDLQPGQEIMLYEHDIFDFNLYKPESFHFTIGFAYPVINKNYINDDTYYYKNVLSALIIGIMLLAAVVNIFFYRVVHEKLYLYFSLFLVFIGLYYLVRYTDIGFLREYRYAAINLEHVFLIGEFFTLMHFIRHFLSTHANTPKWDKFLIILSFLSIIAWSRYYYLPQTLSFKSFSTMILVTGVVIYSYMPIIFGTLLYHIPRNKGSDRAGIYALLPAFAWWSIAYTYSFVSGQLFVFYKIPYTKFYLWIQSSRFLIEFFCFFWLVMVFSWILFKRFQVLQQNVIQALLDKERLEKEKEIERSQLIEKQKEELEIQVVNRTAELKKSIDELKTTQTQLIQSEKMASLGELTAGIAHEIQNPLNFVNNFSEVNAELIEELLDEQKKDTRNLNNEEDILNAIKENEYKIGMHGKRADSIVKGMLQHSKASSGAKEPTNINALADEYMRLAYHGLRAKDKEFNAELITNFDKNLPQINVVQQDIGRVLLNLFNNAFYAVHQKKKQSQDNYAPQVSLYTGKKDSFIEIIVKDNGIGIPDSIKDKIMQPFFTTKPTGEGTGLGLSLSYDIVKKGHGGSISVESNEGAGSEFIIILPIS
jgi:two-component system NtrC family sensor kinase